MNAQRHSRRNPEHGNSAKPYHETPSSLSNKTPTAPTRDVCPADSGFVSMLESRESLTVQNDSKGHPPAKQKGRSISGTEFYIFKSGGKEEARKHYDSVSPAIDALLDREVAEKGHDPSCAMILRLAVIGKTQEDARYWVVVFGRPELEETVRTFFGSAQIAPLLDPSDAPSLPFMFIARNPTMRSALLDVDVCCHDSFGSNCTTYCGAPILLRAGTKGTHRRTKRQATFGGVIKVTYTDGDSRMYGFTAGHVIQDLERQKDASVSETAESNPPGAGAFAEDAWICEYNALGHVLDPKRLPGVAAGCAKPSHDWTLFEVETPRPNDALSINPYEQLAAGGDNLARGILGVARPKFHDGLSEEVLLLGGMQGIRRGELSSLPARIWVSLSEGYVSAYPLELQDGTIEDGDSGAWIVHHASPELYGHVVATDAFGDAYIIPAPDTLENIRECTGAVSVTLPDRHDFTSTEPERNHTEQATSHLPPSFEQGSLQDRYISDSSIHSMKLHKSFIGRKEYQHDHRKAWPEFSNRRYGLEDKSYVQFRREIGEDGDTLDIFLGRDSFDSRPSPAIDDIAQFCRGISVQDVTLGALFRRPRRAAWLDDRSEVLSSPEVARTFMGPLTEVARIYRNPLTANELLEHLRRPRYGSENLPDADRRLMYFFLSSPS
ncbi:hypothetical protein BU26DRAFT_255696 [Trematosphaeria pertusa]|uniref:Uncharacterized protein n=1 Tax=Trematosphaeria pertusa TaxID=390896 RepID=A0A6A6IRB2_9PLEO|nr:uncharacterized protein BU26DRAFT_255696 [Trematosphaeria pertusa]KAF2252342.1 hypothetical protein BU26DRAFT_255696 [Trematosphaeria pertusa]